MRINRWLIALMMLGVAGLAQAADGLPALAQFYNKVHTLSADFQQVQRDDNGQIVQQASGTFLLSRPGKFRWVYKQPYKQIIVSNGQAFKFYDVELAQVTIRSIGGALKATPAVLLTGGKALDQAFKITGSGRHDGLDWVHLTPKARDAEFKSIDLGLNNDVPALMNLHDTLGQTTSINFGNVKINPKLSPSQFTLDVPKNVEVVDGRSQNSHLRPRQGRIRGSNTASGR